MFEELYRTQSIGVFFKHKTKPLNTTNGLLLMVGVTFILNFYNWAMSLTTIMAI